MSKHLETGFSLIEILLSIALVGIIILSIYNIPNSIKLNGSTQKEALAKDITSKQIEQLRIKTYDNIVNGTSTISDARLASLPQSASTVVISDCPISICTNSEQTKQVTVTVTWQDQGKIKKSQITTFISKGGL